MLFNNIKRMGRWSWNGALDFSLSEKPKIEKTNGIKIKNIQSVRVFQKFIT